jgi:hypothetical protein
MMPEEVRKTCQMLKDKIIEGKMVETTTDVGKAESEAGAKTA